MRILFLTLKTFSATGGIEKVCRIAGKAIAEYNGSSNFDFRMYSMHDPANSVAAPYLAAGIFRGFSARKISFIFNSLKAGVQSRVVVLSHINLLLPGYLIKIFSPKTQLLLLAHGIEVWKELSQVKKKMLQHVDLIIPVSTYTKDIIKEMYSMPEEKFHVMNNCLDPFLPEPADIKTEDKQKLREKYEFSADTIILLTLSRLSLKEKNKGYDKVLIAIKELQNNYPSLKYMFVGKYEEAEKVRLMSFASELGIADTIIFTGYISDKEIGTYYSIADIYIIPSEKEGFGISFIEAMYYNKPVIAGNRDGSVDALLDGRLGTLIDPRNQQEITHSIKKVISDLPAFIPDKKLLLDTFSYAVYKERWKKILNNFTDPTN